MIPCPNISSIILPATTFLCRSRPRPRSRDCRRIRKRSAVTAHSKWTTTPHHGSSSRRMTRCAACADYYANVTIIEDLQMVLLAGNAGRQGLSWRSASSSSCWDDGDNLGEHGASQKWSMYEPGADAYPRPLFRSPQPVLRRPPRPAKSASCSISRPTILHLAAAAHPKPSPGPVQPVAGAEGRANGPAAIFVFSEQAGEAVAMTGALLITMARDDRLDKRVHLRRRGRPAVRSRGMIPAPAGTRSSAWA